MDQIALGNDLYSALLHACGPEPISTSYKGTADDDAKYESKFSSKIIIKIPVKF